MNKRIIQTLTDAIYETVHQGKISLKAIADENDMSENYLTRAALPYSEEDKSGSGCRFPLNKLIGVTRSSGTFHILDFCERQVGRVAIKLPNSNGRMSNTDISRAAMKSVREFGELMAKLNEGMIDGRITVNEKALIEIEGYEAIQGIMSLLKVVEEME